MRMSSWLWARFGIGMLCVLSRCKRGMVPFNVIGVVNDDVVYGTGCGCGRYCFGECAISTVELYHCIDRIDCNDCACVYDTDGGCGGGDEVVSVV